MLFFRTASGREPVREWLRELDREARWPAGGPGNCNWRPKMNEKHLGSDFDDFLQEEGLLEDVETVAAKRVRIEMVDAPERAGAAARG